MTLEEKTDLENAIKHFEGKAEGYAEEYYQQLADWLKELKTLKGKAKKYRWHDLRKNPEDLPTADEPVLITYNEQGKEYILAAYQRIYNPFLQNYVQSGAKHWLLPQFYKQECVIAWRYIEEFEEEKDDKS